MEDRVYIRPAGILHGRDAAHALRHGLAAPLAGGPAAFSLAEVSHRCASTGEISRRWLSWPQLAEQAQRDTALKPIVERTTAPRPAIAGLEWRRAAIMGIVNVTPDSFSDGGRHARAEAAIAHGRALAAAGADILDIGGESTRPGATEVPVEEELERIIPVIEALAGDGFTISVDTRKPQVMEAAAAAGAAIINDVSALTYAPDSPSRAAATGLPVILMHALDTPERMQDDPAYEDAPRDIFDALEAAMTRAEAAGIARENLIVDPGIGFGKTLAHNLDLMAELALFHGLGVPLLLGASRKRFIGEITGVDAPAQRLAGSLAAALSAMAAGAAIVRVHDVAQTRQALDMMRAMNR